MSQNWKPNAEQVRTAAQVAQQLPVPIDQLPYTAHFESVYRALNERAGPLTQTQAWNCLLSARKRGLVGSRNRKAKRHK